MLWVQGISNTTIYKSNKSNKDITITSPEMTRFLMSLDNAVDLVDYAFNNCNQGEIFMLKHHLVQYKLLLKH